MGLYTHFNHPTDWRWAAGLPRSHHIVFFWKTLLLIPFIIMVIVEGALFRKWFKQSGYDVFEEWSPYNFGLRIAIGLVPDILYSAILFVLITQRPQRLVRGKTWGPLTLHPGVALAGSIVLMGLQVCALMFNLLLVASNEVFFDNNSLWYVLGYVEQGFQGAFCLCYVWMLVASSVALHRWRREMLKRKDGAVRLLDRQRETPTEDGMPDGRKPTEQV